MPPTTVVHGRELRVKTTAPGRTYYAGDIITGTIERTQSTVSPDAAISITLMGRSKVKLVRVRHSNDANGHSHRRNEYYRSRFHFFQGPGHQNTQILYQGPVHIEDKLNSKQEWQFAMQVPFTTGLDPRMIDNDPECSLLPIDPASVNGHLIPPSTFCNNPEAYIEYFLQADITYTHKGKRRSEQATLPILVGGVRATPSPVALVSYLSPMKQFSAYSLNPNINLDTLSFKQKTKQFFGSSKVPSIAFKVLLYVPKTLQLGSDQILPISARAFKLDPGTTADMRAIPVRAQILGFSAKIITTTKAVAKSTFGGKEDTHNSTTDLLIAQSMYLNKNPLALDIEPEPGITGIGEHLQLRLTSQGATVHGKIASRISPPLTPTFTTYNISCTHKIRYRMMVRVGDKTRELDWEFPVCIIGEPDVTPLLPAFNAEGEPEQPPEFEQHPLAQPQSSHRTDRSFHAFTGVAAPPDISTNSAFGMPAADPAAPPAYSV